MQNENLSNKLWDTVHIDSDDNLGRQEIYILFSFIHQNRKRKTTNQRHQNAVTGKIKISWECIISLFS